MLLTMDQMELLMPDGKEHFKAKDNLTKEEKQKLLNLDDCHFEVFGEHLITNYKELKD